MKPELTMGFSQAIAFISCSRWVACALCAFQHFSFNATSISPVYVHPPLHWVGVWAWVCPLGMIYVVVSRGFKWDVV